MNSGFYIEPSKVTLGLGGEAEETALFLPVMRQVFAQSQQPARRQRVGLTPEVKPSKT
jgi:hypothetical protein